MTAIWHRSPAGWAVLQPSGFSAEALLHDLVEDAPQLLPLAGSPSLVVVGREVHLGGGYADLLAVDATADLAIVELKLASNAEARRAVVAQVLSYAAFLDHMSYQDLEQRVLGDHLRARGIASLAAAGAASAQGPFDETLFRETLASNLSEGRFRLVIVLDAIPRELPRLVSYLEGVADNLLIDLIAVSSYEVGGELVLVPHRIEPERRPAEIAATSVAGSATIDEDGPEAFRRVVASDEDESRRAEAERLLRWATALETRSLAKLMSVRGRQADTLRISVPGDMSLACIYLDRSGPHVSVYRSVFVRRAPGTLAELEGAVGPKVVGQGSNVDPSDAVLTILAKGYEEASQPRRVAHGGVERDAARTGGGE